jgi:hypothetical protein
VPGSARPLVVPVLAVAVAVAVAVAQVYGLGLSGCNASGSRNGARADAGRAAAEEEPLTAASAVAPPRSFGVACAEDRGFPSRLELPEASAAAEVELVPGVREMLVVSDSGHAGRALAWRIAPPADDRLRRLDLPLDRTASDDLEGMAWVRDEQGTGHLYTLTSSGAARRFTPDRKGKLARDQNAYAIGPPPGSCDDLGSYNCGRNYEGLCLRPPGARARCAGYAASKAESTLYCVVYDGARLELDPVKPPLRLDLRKRALSDCAFGAVGGPAESRLLVTTNIYGGSSSYVVDESTGALTPLPVAGLASNEALAVDREGALYQFMDDNSDTSPASRMTCTWP